MQSIESKKRTASSTLQQSNSKKNKSFSGSFHIKQQSSLFSHDKAGKQSIERINESVPVVESHPYTSIDHKRITQSRTATSEKRRPRSRSKRSISPSIHFSPSKSYMHTKKCFEFQKRQKCDRVKIFHRSASVWNTDSFLRNNNYKHSHSSLVSKEGRKLNLADFNKRMKE